VGDPENSGEIHKKNELNGAPPCDAMASCDYMYKGLFSFLVSVPWAFEWSQGEHPAKIVLFVVWKSFGMFDGALSYGMQCVMFNVGSVLRLAFRS
jgi:hypothetical protein